MPRKRISCEYEGCTRSYCSAFNLKRHIESAHFGLRKFKCPVCGRFLSSKQNLIDHQNIHSGSKPYSCEILGCNLQFRQLSQYYLHKQLHSEVSQHLSLKSSILETTLELLVKKITQQSNQITLFLSNEPSEIVELPIITIEKEKVQLPLLKDLCKL